MEMVRGKLRAFSDFHRIMNLCKNRFEKTLFGDADKWPCYSCEH